MECKGKYKTVSKKKGRIGIYPEWNVKLTCFFFFVFRNHHWNISRMECKVNRSTS